MGMNGANSPRAMHIAQKMRTDLGKAGFTDIHIMPSSFLVRAKDSSGNPVMMVINPDSVTEITEQNASNATHKGAIAQSGTNTTGGLAVHDAWRISDQAVAARSSGRLARPACGHAGLACGTPTFPRTRRSLAFRA